jgi:FkbM family methyltransferase
MEEWQYKQINALKKIIQPDWTYLDIGCATGEMLSFFIDKMPSGYAFEPQPNNYYYLVNKFGHIKNTKIIQKAVSDINGPSDFWTHPTSTHEGNLLGHNTSYIKYSDSNKITVECITLDNFLSTHNADLIKIDVEGAEWKIFKGAKETLKKQNIIYQVEFHLDEDWHNRDILYDNGYEIYTLDFNKLNRAENRPYQALLIHKNHNILNRIFS